MRYTNKIGVSILFILFSFYLVSWMFLNLFIPHDSEYFNYFTDSYSLIAAVGGFCGYLASRQWGGLRSVMGRSLAFFSAGLFFQFLGQVTYAIYFYIFHIENAYPSVGDFFYFGSIPLYVIAIFHLFKVLQVNTHIRNSLWRVLVSVIIPLSFVSLAYYLFMRDYEFGSGFITTFLDFGYPFGDAFFLGLTIVAFLFSTSTLGGKLKSHVILLFVSLAIQYFADTTYLAHTINETWRPGGLDDLFYLASYAAMGFTLIGFGQAVEGFLSNSRKVVNG